MTKSGTHLPHFRELDGVRGLAALAVFFHHLCYAAVQGTTGWIWPIRMLYRVSEFGYAGVDFFFVLSGFLITLLLLKDKGNPAFYRDFYWKRALRIVPMYALCLLSVWVAFPHSGEYVLLSALFLANLAPVMKVAMLGPFWSLAIEEQFYLIWPAVLRYRSPAVLMRWAAGVWAGVIVLRFALVPAGHHDYSLTPLRVDGLAAGALLACRYYRLHFLGESSIVGVRLQAAAAAMGLLLAGIGYELGQAHRGAVAAAALQSGIGLLAAGCIGLLIDSAGSPRLRWLRSAPLLFYGAISYAFYMTHSYVMMGYEKLFGGVAPGDTKAYFVRLLTVLTATTLLCVATRYTIELPAISLRRYVLARPTPPPESAVPLQALLAEEHGGEPVRQS